MAVVSINNRPKRIGKAQEKTLETNLIFMPLILDDNVPTIVNGTMDPKALINSRFMTKEIQEKLNKLYKEIIIK